MGNENEKANTRSTQEKFEFNSISGGDGVIGRESEVYRYQQERINRENSSQPSLFFTYGEPVLGGTLGQLIDEHETQLATKGKKIERLKDEIAQEEEDIKRIAYRVREFRTLLDKLRQQPETI